MVSTLVDPGHRPSGGCRVLAAAAASVDHTSTGCSSSDLVVAVSRSGSSGLSIRRPPGMNHNKPLTRIDQHLFDQVALEAQQIPRLRLNHNFH